MHQNTQSMYRNQPPVVGIDVGGIKKGFHAVAILEGCLLAQSEPISSPQEVAAWCTGLGAAVVAIDAPSAWAHAGTSRRCERDLAVNNINVSCFSTPERRLAEGRTFYDWVRNGERLYQAIRRTDIMYTAAARLHFLWSSKHSLMPSRAPCLGE